MLWSVGQNWIDIAILGMLAWSAWAGYHRGFVLEVLNLGRIVVGFALAARYGTTVGIELQNATGLPPLLTPALGVAAVFLVSQLALGLVIGFVAGPMIGVLHRLLIVGQLDRIGGLALATLQSMMWLALGLAVLLPVITFALQRQSPDQPGRDARLATWLASVGEHFIPRLRDYVNPPSLTDLIQSGGLTRHVGANETVPLHFLPGLQPRNDTVAEARMLSYVNEQRTQRQLPALIAEDRLSLVARQHSQDMFARSYFGHTSPDGVTPFDRLRVAGYRYRVAGENIAYAPNVDLADTGMMNSPEHRANILGPDFHHVGIGVVSGGIFEEMFTQEFSD